MEYIRSAHSVYLLTYHIVFVTKYRKPVINDEISEFLKNHIGYLCTRFDAELLTAETDRDHIHMLISMPPKVAPADLIRVLKTQTARKVHLRGCSIVAAFLLCGNDRDHRHGEGQGIHRLPADGETQAQIRKDRKVQ